MSKEKQEFETILASYSEYSQTINQAILDARSELTLSCTILANDADTEIRELRTQKGSVIFFFSKKDGRWETLHKMDSSETNRVLKGFSIKWAPAGAPSAGMSPTEERSSNEGST